MTDYGNAHETGRSTESIVTAFFDRRSDAEAAVERLRSRGVPDAAIRLTARLEGESAGAPRSEPKGFFESLADLFVPNEDRYAYAEGLSRGGSLVIVTGVTGDLYDAALDVLDDAGAVDIDERSAAWQAEGWSGYQGGVGTSAGASVGSIGQENASLTGRDDTFVGEDEAVPVVEERLRVGKRDVSHGRVRIRTYVRAEPVTEQVQLGEERVVIERRAVDRPLTGAEDVFRERTIEAEERAEEAVVSKETRVVEEVGLRRERESHEETISDTVRRTEVEIEDDRTDADRLTRGRP